MRGRTQTSTSSSTSLRALSALVAAALLVAIAALGVATYYYLVKRYAEPSVKMVDIYAAKTVKNYRTVAVELVVENPTDKRIELVDIVAVDPSTPSGYSYFTCVGTCVWNPPMECGCIQSSVPGGCAYSCTPSSPGLDPSFCCPPGYTLTSYTPAGAYTVRANTTPGLPLYVEPGETYRFVVFFERGEAFSGSFALLVTVTVAGEYGAETIAVPVKAEG